MRKPNAIPGGAAMPLDRKKKKPTAISGGGGAWIGGPQTASSEKYKQGKKKREPATSYSSQNRLNALQKTGDSRAVDYGTEGNASEQTGTSIFDPVLCEIAYRWFCPPGGLVLDPFAGGSVRGIVAAKLGRRYIGVDLSERQIEANRMQAEAIVGGLDVKWIIGDSRDALPDVEADFIFSCPPYADLERYSDDPADISTMDYADFKDAYFDIIKKACDRLKPDRFACFVVGEVRDSKGNYIDFVGDTVQAFRDARLEYYNEAILITAVGSLPIRVGRQFSAGRKLGKTHQNVLVFVKGDAKQATAAIGDVDFNLGMDQLSSDGLQG